MRIRAMETACIALVIISVAVSVAVLRLNASQYGDSRDAIKSDFQNQLNRTIESVEASNRETESRLLLDHNEANLTLARCLEQGLYVVCQRTVLSEAPLARNRILSNSVNPHVAEVVDAMRDGNVRNAFRQLYHMRELMGFSFEQKLLATPACFADDMKHPMIDATVGVAAFREGLEHRLQGDTEAARVDFEQAARMDAASSDDLYVRMSAMVHLLSDPKAHHERIIFEAAELLTRERAPMLTESQVRFFDALLRESESTYAKRKNACLSAWAEIRSIEALDDIRLPVRLASGDMIISINEKGRTVRYRPQWGGWLKLFPSVRLSDEAPAQEECFLVHKLDMPLHRYLWIPVSIVEQRIALSRRQYVLTNIAIAVVLPLCIGLALAILLVMKHQRQLSQLRTRFVATVSHELRTPLSLIRLHAETLFHGRVSSDRIKDYSGTILTETERLTGVVNNVVDFSRFERHVHRVAMVSIHVSGLCCDMLARLHHSLRNEHVDLKTEIEPDIYAQLDALSFSQVIFNLIDNAIKYSGERKMITVRLARLNDTIKLSILDQGIGVPDEIKSAIFDEFFRADDPRVTNQRGSGIGLAVTRKLLESMGCSICVADNTTCGSIFIVTIPAGDGGESGERA